MASIASQRGAAIHEQRFANKRTDKIQQLEFQANQIAGLISGASSAVQTGASAYRDFRGGEKPPPPGGQGSQFNPPTTVGPRSLNGNLQLGQ